ncbi:hypothetical protein V7S43_009558 [Phytophthora oleae]|uniref:Uncharacterized protein n=1 Tax=Phytophthora oleae TaxID=2107226 RepID=A0ABD3FEY8_9STRA
MNHLSNWVREEGAPAISAVGNQASELQRRERGILSWQLTPNTISETTTHGNTDRFGLSDLFHTQRKSSLAPGACLAYGVQSRWHRVGHRSPTGGASSTELPRRVF